MKEYSYHFEQVDLLNLFVSAFDDTFLYRYDAKTREAKERIDVRYIAGPKHRVLHDLNDRAKTLSLPVVTIEQTGYSKDLPRVFNKNKKFKYEGDDGVVYTVPAPVPVNLDVKLSVICKFKEDLDQIIQNFTTHCNPYIIVSWKEPEKFGLPFLNEIRTEIQWGGDVSLEYPNNINSDDKWRIMADTTFTIKGWVFPPFENQVANIYYIDMNFHTVDTGVQFFNYDDYHRLSAVSLTTDMLTISGIPTFTNVFYVYGSNSFPILEDITIKNTEDNKFKFYGNMFDRENNFHLSANVSNFHNDFELISTQNSPLISGYKIPDDWVSLKSDDMFSLMLSSNILSTSGKFNVITSNEAGWDKSPYNINLTVE